MGARLASLPVLLLAAGALAAPPAGELRLKPGARGGACLECHEDFQRFLAQPFVHTPVEAGDCTDCHDPHTAVHGSLLADHPTEVCTACHDGMLAAAGKSAHEMVAAGRCVVCHDPHAAPHENVLRREGSALCLDCHAEIGRAVSDRRFAHGPAEEGCLTCHTPHASAEASFLLRRDEPELCLECHDPAGEFFVEEHMGYPVAEGRCSSCHDPHGSDTEGLLWPRVHAPVTTKMCKQCHEDASSPEALDTRRRGYELCRACHNTMVNETLTATRLHWPVVGEASCLSCHRAHASREEALLSEPPESLCGSCHEDTMRKQQLSAAKHAPVEEGACSACHDPHASEQVFLLGEGDLNRVCGTCHDWQLHSSHPIGDDVKDQRNPNLSLDCSSCHSSHGSEHEHFAHWDIRSELCIQCHRDLRR